MSIKKFVRSDTENDSDLTSDFEDIAKKSLKVTHQLIPKWTFWVWKMDESKTSWEDCLRDVCTISTIEEFWALHHRLLQPSKLKNGDFCLFLSGKNYFKNDKEV